MKEFKRIVRDTKSLKIQGAQAVAKNALVGLRDVLLTSRAKSVNRLLNELVVARNKLVSTRATEPGMRNSLAFVFSDLDYSDLRSFTMSVKTAIAGALGHLRNVNKKIAEFGAMKISNGMVVFTHCHSSTVVSVLKEAKRQGKKFSVHNTETRPQFQGRKTARELAAAGIPVTHYVDSAARLAIKKADLMLIGADAVTSEGKVINKIGSELFAEVASRLDIPAYSCTDSWKFDPKSVFGFEEPIEQRGKKEVWPRIPKGVTVDNHAFEQVDSESLTGVITELGVYKAEVLVEIISQEYPWMMG